MDNKTLSNLIFPNIDKTPDYYEELYPPRSLAEGVKVARFAPSPTGYMHLGNLFSSFIDYLIAGADGIFYIRIEDTDKKREVADAIEKIHEGMSFFGLNPNEGVTSAGEKGAYGPYKQSDRNEIYHCFVKKLFEQGYAYPCFCSEEELNSLREKQEKAGANPGYYGEYACCRALSPEEQEKRINAGDPYIIRLRSDGDESRKIFVDDLIKGKLEMPENVQDIVLLKTDKTPTYHFAHAVDDHLMRTTHVIRGDDWLPSLPVHIQLFKLLSFKPPKYAHIAPIMKIDAETGNKRKLSKRKDPENSLSFFVEHGYPKEGVLDYLLTLANSNFEDWRRANPKSGILDFPFNLKKMSPSGALFDLAKLNDICKNIISLMSAGQVYENTLKYAESYDKELYDLLSEDPDYAKAVLSIDRDVPKPRKDIAAWSQLKDYVSYFYDSLYSQAMELPENVCVQDAAAILNAYIELYNENDSKDEWFSRIKSMCEGLGFTPNVKDFKASPEKYKGHVGDLSTVIRFAVTGRANTPDLYSIMRLLGKNKVIERLKNSAANLI